MAIEIEGPFGDDANDLPIEEYILDLEKVLRGMRAHKLARPGEEEGEGAAEPVVEVKKDVAVLRQERLQREAGTPSRFALALNPHPSGSLSPSPSPSPSTEPPDLSLCHPAPDSITAPSRGRARREERGAAAGQARSA